MPVRSSRRPKAKKSATPEPTLPPTDPRADYLSCVRAGVHRMRGYRGINAQQHLGRVPDYQEVVVPLQRAGSVWWSREELRRDAAPAELTLEERLSRYVVRRFVPEIKRRGGEVYIHGKYDTKGLELAHKQGGYYLLRAEGWREYSRRFGARMARIAYLCGSDDNGIFAVRVPATIGNVGDALARLMPAEVQRAQKEGRRVLRQGDVWIVEQPARAKDRFDRLPDSHVWDPKRRVLKHRPSDGRNHKPVKVPFAAKAVPQVALQMGRDGAAVWGSAD